MKKETKLLVINTFLVTLLCSCSFTSLEFVPYQNFIKEVNTKYELNNDGYYKLKDYESLSYFDFDGNEKFITNLSDIRKSSNNGRYYSTSLSTGEQKVAVLPVSFKNSLKTNKEEKLIYLQNAFFGIEEKTSHESLTSFYNKSSFGKLKIDGEVLPFVDIPYTSDELSNLGSKTAVSRFVSDLALQNALNQGFDFKSYDKDQDGYIDNLFIIYDYPYSNLANTLYWAYVDYMNQNEKVYLSNKEININNHDININGYAWVSFDFLKPKHHQVDTHVIIHEMGHLLGLQDYYSDGIYQPLGYMDMMDYNLGDHNIFSKMLLNWTTPFVLKDETSITLKPSFESGDCLIIPSINQKRHDLGWNKTPYDEMLVLEFYAPEGVNKCDSNLSFNYVNGLKEEKNGRLFTNYGIKLYHVDSRVGIVKNKFLPSYVGLIGDDDLTLKQDQYQKECQEAGLPLRWCLDFPFNNKNTAHPYIKLIESHDKFDLLNGNAASNASLFKKGDTFNLSNDDCFKFYDGSSLAYGFKIENITPNEAKISFIKR